MKLPRINLLTRILIAIILGIGAGIVFPHALARVFVTFNGIFSELLGFCIPLIIIGFVAPAIADIGSRAGKMLLIPVTDENGNVTYDVTDALKTGKTYINAVFLEGRVDGFCCS